MIPFYPPSLPDLVTLVLLMSQKLGQFIVKENGISFRLSKEFQLVTRAIITLAHLTLNF
jgi:hypothetical protein